MDLAMVRTKTLIFSVTWNKYFQFQIIYIQSNLCLTTTFGTFQNGLNRQMVVLYRLDLGHSFTYAFTHFYEYYIITINITISIENALSIKLSISKYNHCRIFPNKEKNHTEF